MTITRITIPLVLTGAICVGVWTAAGSYHRIESQLAAVAPEVLQAKYMTRLEMSRWHNDLEKQLNRSGVIISFPPPYDPIDVRFPR